MSKNIITIDVDKLQEELEAQELMLDEAEWMAVIVSLKRAEVKDEPTR